MQDRRSKRRERRHKPERRGGHDRRRPTVLADDFPRAPTWEEQRAQYLTRLFYFTAGLAYFNLGFGGHELRLEPLVVNGVIAAIMAVHLVGFWHARREPRALWRLHGTMWLDLIGATFAIVADPTVPSPGFLVYIVIILGNGLRYGMGFFAAAVAGSFAGAAVGVGLRHHDYVTRLTPSVALFLVFGGILALYAYALNARIERTRRQLEAERGLDELTGLMNRRAFHERAEPVFRELAGGTERLVVLFADLDGFKGINDNHGHHVGDRVLARIGRAIGDSVRRSDVVARYGGDEFVLLLLGADVERGTMVAHRLQQTVREWARENSIDLSVSIGLGEFSQPDCDLKGALARVDQAMYQGKLARERGGIRVAEAAVGG
jgi:diguanylate cyclase (GGDEF)-like protein